MQSLSLTLLYFSFKNVTVFLSPWPIQKYPAGYIGAHTVICLSLFWQVNLKLVHGQSPQTWLSHCFPGMKWPSTFICFNLDDWQIDIQLKLLSYSFWKEGYNSLPIFSFVILDHQYLGNDMIWIIWWQILKLTVCWVPSLIKESLS